MYAAQSEKPANHNWLDRLAINITAPVQSLLESSVDGVSDAWSDYFYLVGVREENRILKIENRKLQRAMSERSEQFFENHRLRNVLAMKQRNSQAAYKVGEVVAISPNPLFRSIRINLGSSDGIQEGLAVIDSAGVVGRVKAVATHYSDIILLVDVNNSIDVLVQRTRARARVRGSGGDKELGVDVERLARTANVEPGDILVTSGIGDRFPRGIPVGQVTVARQSQFGLYQQVKLEPSVDFSQLETVMVVMDVGGSSPVLSGPRERAPKIVPESVRVP